MHFRPLRRSLSETMGIPDPLYGGCSLRDERVQTPCTPVGIKTQGGRWNARNKFAFPREGKCAQNLCFTNQLNKYRGTKRLVYDRLCNISLDPSCFPTLGSRGYFFLIDTDLIVPRRSRVNEARSAERKEREPYQTVAEALLNHKHGLFHIRYFENGPLEPG